MQVMLLRLSFLSLLVFSELLDSDIIQCIFTRAVAQKQQQMLERLQSFSFFQNEIYHASGVGEVVIFKSSSDL